jgi:hypothetical protein
MSDPSGERMGAEFDRAPFVALTCIGRMHCVNQADWAKSRTSEKIFSRRSLIKSAERVILRA